MEKMNHLTADDFKRMAALANQIGEGAKKRGMEFAYHNHNVEFRKLESGKTGYDILLGETDPKLVKLEVDTGWVAAGGANPPALKAANAERVRMIHYKDFSTVTPPINELGGDGRQHIVDLGKGVAPLKEPRTRLRARPASSTSLSTTIHHSIPKSRARGSQRRLRVRVAAPMAS